jgi:hypothetical protein
MRLRGALGRFFPWKTPDLPANRHGAGVFDLELVYTLQILDLMDLG